MNTTRRSSTPWLVMSIIHGIGALVTLGLFAMAAITESVFGIQAQSLAAGWALAGVVLAPLITLATAIWWISGRQKEALPVRPEPKPYDGMPATATSLQRVPASAS